MKKSAISLAILAFSFAAAQESPKQDSVKTKAIEEVIVTKKIIQKKSDRLVFDVSASPVAKGNTAFSLIKETPLVSSTDDKTLKIAGKSNAVIYINGKRTQMNADAMEAFLKNTPAENIARIEVITLPGSEFNVESSDGIINIILKKKMTDGISGNLTARNVQHRDNNQYMSGTLNYRKGKFAASGNFSYSNFLIPQDYVLMNGKGAEFNKSVGFTERNSRDAGGYLTLDYDINEKNSVGLSYNLWRSNELYQNSDFFNTVQAYDQNNVLQTSYNRSRNTGFGKDQNHSVNLNYERKLDDQGSKISLNTAYLKYNASQINANLTEITDQNNQFISVASMFNQSTPQHIDNYSGTLDFVKQFKNFKLGAGGNFNFTKTDNDTQFEVWNGTQYISDPNQSNHFVYDEKISGLYLNAEKNFGEKFSAKAGARLEFTDSFGEVLGTSSTVSRKNTNLLPTLSLNYNINANHNISYAFTSRVKRPSFWEINPTRTYLTQVNYIQNNPFLRASSIFNQELMYMYKNTYFLQLSNSNKRDANNQVPLQKKDAEGNITLRYIRMNYGTENNFSATAGMNRTFFEQIWSANYAVGLNVNSFSGTVDTDPITGEQFDPFVFAYSMATPFIQANNNIRLSSAKDWFLGINYFWLGKQRADLGTIDPLQKLDLSVKKIWDDWTVALELRDVFRTMEVSIYDLQKSGNFNQINQYQYSRRAVLTITHTFGNKKVQKTRKIDSAADEIKTRTGN